VLDRRGGFLFDPRRGAGAVCPAEDIIARHLGELFGGLRVVSHTVFRVTRNTDLTTRRRTGDLLEMIEESLRQRRRSDPYAWRSRRTPRRPSWGC